MKKLILMMFAAMFLCNTSYGATIKELLGGQKSLTLACVIESSKSFSNGKKREDTFVGDKYSIKIVVTKKNDDGSAMGDLYINGTKKTDGKNKDQFFIYKDNFEFYGIDPISDSIKIDRVNGVFKRMVYPRSGGIRVEIGTCEKVTENKF